MVAEKTGVVEVASSVKHARYSTKVPSVSSCIWVEIWVGLTATIATAVARVAQRKTTQASLSLKFKKFLMASEIIKWIVCRGLLIDADTASHMALWLVCFAMQRMGRTAALGPCKYASLHRADYFSFISFVLVMNMAVTFQPCCVKVPGYWLLKTACSDGITRAHGFIDRICDASV